MASASNLAELAEGREAIITGLRGSGPVHQRLLDMGLTRGARVRFVGRAPLGDPIYICLMGYHLALRSEEARGILVDPLPEGPDAPDEPEASRRRSWRRRFGFGWRGD